jgi:hypothetical protein
MSLDESPGLWRLFKVSLLILLDDSEARSELTTSQDVEAALDFFFSVLVRNTAQRHIIETLLLVLTFFTSFIFKFVLGLVPNLFSLVSRVLFYQSLLIINLHVHRVVHQSLSKPIISLLTYF